MKRAKSIKDLNAQLGRMWNLYPNNRRIDLANRVMLNLVKRTADKIGVPRVYDKDSWWFDHKIFYANYETKVVL